MYIPGIIPDEDRKIMERRYRKSPGSGWTSGRNTAVIVVDMTNGFVEDDFPTGYSRTGKPCAASIRELLDEARSRKMPVIYTKDVEETGELYRLYRGAWNFNTTPVSDEQKEAYNTIHPLLEPGSGELVIRKSKPSAFFGTSLVGLLNYMKVDSLIVTGMVTSGCVRATVIDAFSYNFRVVVPIECVADRSQVSHEVSLFDLDSKYASVLPLEEVIATIRATPA